MNQITFPDQVVEAIRQVVGMTPVGLHEPNFNGKEKIFLQECLDSGYVSSIGKFVDEFEQKLAIFTGAKYAVCVVNGTAALQIALKIAGVQPGDEVLCPALTFVATANAISHCGAIPHFVDCSPTDLGIDAIKLREYLEFSTEKRAGAFINKQSKRTIRAIVPMHTFGHPSDLDGLMSVAEDYNLVLVEDSAESLGSFYKGQHTGTFGALGILSFNGNKIITTGGGGAILTNDETLAKRAKHITTTAKIKHKWEFDHDEVGFNFRMPNINAALGCAQIEDLPEKIISKKRLFLRYKQAFADVAGVNLFVEPKECSSNYWLQTLVLDCEKARFRDEVLETSHKLGITTRPAWNLMSNLKPYRDTPRMNLEQSISMVARIINLPSSPSHGDIST